VGSTETTERIGKTRSDGPAEPDGDSGPGVAGREAAAEGLVAESIELLGSSSMGETKECCASPASVLDGWAMEWWRRRCRRG
jgi:hypothetical protein